MDHGPRPSPVALGPDYEALLRVALLPEAETTRAWHELEPRLTQAVFDDPRAVPIMPAVARALTTAGIDAATRDRMKGIGRHNFAGNQMALADARAALGALDEERVEALALDGVPLLLRYYDDVSLRATHRAELLVPEAKIATAIAALERAGWPGDLAGGRTRVRHRDRILLRAGDQRGGLMVRHRLVPWVDRRTDRDDAELWRRAQPLDVLGHPSAAPSAEDLLLTVVLGAFRRGWRTFPAWVLDAWMVLQRTPEFDWNYVTRRVIDGHLAAPMGDALGYARDLVRLRVPDDALGALGHAVVTRGERRRYEQANDAITGQRHAVLGQVRDLRVVWARRALNLTTTARLRAAVSLVVEATNANRLLGVPAAVVRNRRAAARTRRAAGRRPPDDSPRTVTTNRSARSGDVDRRA